MRFDTVAAPPPAFLRWRELSACVGHGAYPRARASSSRTVDQKAASQLHTASRSGQKAASQQEARQESHDHQTGPQLRRVGSTPKNVISFDNALDNDLFEIGLDDVVAVEDESDIEDGGRGGGRGGGGGTTTAAENFLEQSQRSLGPGTGLRRDSSVSFTNPMLDQRQLTAMAKSARGFTRSDIDVRSLSTVPLRVLAEYRPGVPAEYPNARR